MKKQRNIFQTRDQDKTPDTDLNKTEVSKLSNRLQLTDIKMLTVVRSIFAPSSFA